MVDCDLLNNPVERVRFELNLSESAKTI